MTNFDKRLLAVYLLPFILFAAVVLTIYFNYGAEWNFIAHYLNAEALDSSNFLTALLPLSHGTSIYDSIVMGKGIYFEAYRAPLSYVMMAVAIVASGKYAIPVYLAVVAAAFAAVSYYVSRAFKINPLLFAALIVSPYVIVFSSLFDSEELLSFVALIGTLALLRKGRWEAGLLFGLASLSKYTSLIFIPMLLLLGKPKKVAYAYAAFFIVTLPWMLFNYYAFGNPLYTYLAAINVAREASLQGGISLQALTIVFAFFIPALVALFVINATSWKRLRVIELLRRGGRDIGSMIIALFVGLSLVEFLILGLHNSTFDQARYAYPLYIGLALAIAYAIERSGTANVKIGRFVASKAGVAAAILISFSVLSICLTAVAPYTLPHFDISFADASNSALYSSAAMSLRDLNISNCVVISNAWVYMRYEGINAFSPFAYNATILRYPALIFANVGVNKSSVELINITHSYSYTGYSIYLPGNFLCAGK